MNFNKTLRTAAVIAASALIFTACKKDDDTTVVDPGPNTGENVSQMHFMLHNYFDGNEIELNTGNYTNQQNEQMTISTINYWFTNVKFIKSDGSEYAEEESYRLIRGDQSNTMHFHVSDVPDGTYKGVKFMIGVDVASSTSGAQAGALDPAINGDMYWDWNTGYIQLKLEGTSPASTATDNAYKFHIGGVGQGIETPREVTLMFPSEVTVGEKDGSIHLIADVDKFFGPSTPVKIADKAIFMMPGQKASDIADNYAQMFRIMKAGNE